MEDDRARKIIVRESWFRKRSQNDPGMMNSSAMVSRPSSCSPQPTELEGLKTSKETRVPGNCQAIRDFESIRDMRDSLPSTPIRRSFGTLNNSSTAIGLMQDA